MTYDTSDWAKECEALEAVNAELLTALVRTLSWLQSYPGGRAQSTYNQARVAIAKARGANPEEREHG